MKDDPWTAANRDKEQLKIPPKTQANACEGIAAVQANSLGTFLDR
jgi:hypothetical protein